MIINQPDTDYIANIFVVMLVWSKLINVNERS